MPGFKIFLSLFCVINATNHRVKIKYAVSKLSWTLNFNIALNDVTDKHRKIALFVL